MPQNELNVLIPSNSTLTTSDWFITENSYFTG